MDGNLLCLMSYGTWIIFLFVAIGTRQILGHVLSPFLHSWPKACTWMALPSLYWCLFRFSANLKIHPFISYEFFFACFSIFLGNCALTYRCYNRIVSRHNSGCNEVIFMMVQYRIIIYEAHNKVIDNYEK